MENITTINAADLAKLRDQLNLKLGAYNEAVKNNKIAANEIKNTLQQINEDHLKVLHAWQMEEIIKEVVREKGNTLEDTMIDGIKRGVLDYNTLDHIL